jgi:hypothetical protein
MLRVDREDENVSLELFYPEQAFFPEGLEPRRQFFKRATLDVDVGGAGTCGAKG